jgi:outer membrane lipoprotein-sorting protein
MKKAECRRQKPGLAQGLWRRWWAVCILQSAVCLFLAGTAVAESGSALLDRWISAQTNLHTWTADCTQTRSLKVLAQPLVATGKVWVMVPDRFRWELGQPAQTVALRQPDQLLILYPRLKRAEKYPLGGVQTGPWKDALALLEASFPRSRADLESHFRVLSVTETNSAMHITLQPKSATARKFMAEIQVDVSTNGFSPFATELRFSDGSSMRNDFTNVAINTPLAEELFDAKLDPSISVVEPLRQ